MIVELRPLRLAGLNVGDVYLLNDPVRIVQVVRLFAVDVKDAQTAAVRQQPAVEVLATVPYKEVPGYVTKAQADGNLPTFKACKRNMDGTDDSRWFETWTERYVPTVKLDRKPAVIDEQHTRIQLAVMSVMGRREARERSSPCRGKEVVGLQVPLDIVPKEFFAPSEPPGRPVRKPKEQSDAIPQRSTEAVLVRPSSNDSAPVVETHVQG